MTGCQPALFVVPPGGGKTAEEACPPSDDVLQAALDALEDHGWTEASDIIVDVREGELSIQDEVPPADPVDIYGVALAFSQTAATFTHGYEGPFRIAQRGIHEAFPDLEIWISAVPSPGGGA